MNDVRLIRLNRLREELAGIPAASYPEKLWDCLEGWIAKARPIVRSDWFTFLDDFENTATESSEIDVVFVEDNFTISSSEHKRLWRRENEKAEQVRKKLLNFLDGLLMMMPAKQETTSALEKVIFICERFPIFSRRLRTRGRDREPLRIDDEYDLQYLLAALFRLYFDDVREEVWIPTYAGGNSRMDFLLKQERIIVETKKTRGTLRDRKVADQLIVDIKRYAEYPDYHTLVCFVYDPDGFIDNPRGLEHDLSKRREEIDTLVLVRP
jgi:deoxyadenosine/deoxycytidine kinase